MTMKVYAALRTDFSVVSHGLLEVAMVTEHGDKLSLSCSEDASAKAPSSCEYNSLIPGVGQRKDVAEFLRDSGEDSHYFALLSWLLCQWMGSFRAPELIFATTEEANQFKVIFNSAFGLYGAQPKSVSSLPDRANDMGSNTLGRAQEARLSHHALSMMAQG
jgi:hypothetical protein